MNRLSLLLLVLAGLALPACGEDDGGPAGTTVDVVFGAGGMTVNPTSVRSGQDVTLNVSSQDGRPHGVTLQGAPTPVRVVVTPGQSKRSAAGELPDGRYRVAPDGAAEPVPLTIGP